MVFRLLITKMIVRKRTMKIVERHDPKKGSSYRKNVVSVNLAFYEESGIGISSRKYFYIDEKEHVKTKLKSLAGSIFHEFCHALHHISRTRKKFNILCRPFRNEMHQGTHAWADSGYDGLKNIHEDSETVKKKPKKGELTDAEKAWNRALSQVRVIVENILGDIKVFRTV